MPKLATYGRTATSATVAQNTTPGFLPSSLIPGIVSVAPWWRQYPTSRLAPLGACATRVSAAAGIASALGAQRSFDCASFLRGGPWWRLWCRCPVVLRVRRVGAWGGGFAAPPGFGGRSRWGKVSEQRRG